jgi:integrase/recombinase XerD
VRIRYRQAKNEHRSPVDLDIPVHPDLQLSSTPRLAERGATAHEIMAITGHRSLEEVERYTRAARQGRLADAAMMKFKSRTDSVPPK